MAQVTELAGHVLGGKYRLVRSVSDGPRKVYEARHERLAGRVAVKLWPATTPWDVFRQGAELAVTLRHPGVMQVLDFNCEPGSSPFLVLEWIDGTRLSDVIAEAGILPIERVAPLVESAAWALASAHQQGVVHQELRPDEIFVVHAPGTMREWVKLGGFGVSAALARAGMATPSRYRAPEQNAAPDGEGDDPQSDQYTLAAIAYEMLAGVPPFDEERSRAEPLPISDVAPGVSPAVDAAIRQALEREPEQRFAGVLEFARALRDAVDGASPEALRRRSAAASASSDRRARATEPVSPFFNPLQGRASEVIRRVASSSTARLRTLTGPGPLLRGRPTARIALASGVLLLAVTSTALVMRRPAPKSAPAMAAHTPTAAPAATAASTARPEPTPAPEPEPSAPTPAAAAEPAPSAPGAAGAPGAVAVEDDATPAKPSRAAAWARLASGTRATPSAAAKPKTPPPHPAAPPKLASAVTKPAPKHAPAPKTAAAPKIAVAAAPAKSPVTPAKPPVAPVKPLASTTPGPCTMSVGSRPPADVWLDDHSLGRRTPLVKYRVACGDHKLALKRTDLDLYQMEIVTLRVGAPFKKVYPLQ